MHVRPPKVAINKHTGSWCRDILVDYVEAVPYPAAAAAGRGAGPWLAHTVPSLSVNDETEYFPRAALTHIGADGSPALPAWETVEG